MLIASAAHHSASRRSLTALPALSDCVRQTATDQRVATAGDRKPLILAPGDESKEQAAMVPASETNASTKPLVSKVLHELSHV